MRQMTAIISSGDTKSFITAWNAVFPIDKWWREKHGIPFGSEAHKESHFSNMLAEYYEDTQLFKHVSDPDEYVAGSGDIFIRQGEPSNEEYDDLFDNLDISKF